MPTFRKLLGWFREEHPQNTPRWRLCKSALILIFFTCQSKNTQNHSFMQKLRPINVICFSELQNESLRQRMVDGSTQQTRFFPYCRIVFYCSIVAIMVSFKPVTHVIFDMDGLIFGMYLHFYVLNWNRKSPPQFNLQPLSPSRIFPIY